MQRIKRLFRQLQWKLTFSYTLITIVAILLIEFLTVLVVLGYFLFNQAEIQVSSLRNQATQALPFFVHNSPDQATLAHWLASSGKLVTPQLDAHTRGFLCVLDIHGRVLASLGDHPPAVASTLTLPSRAVSPTQLHALLNGEVVAISLSEPEQMQLIVVPIRDGQQRPVGALVAHLEQLNLANVSTSYGRLLSLFGVNILLLTLLVGIVGTFFGFFTARSFTRRFTRLTLAADHWSRGDFSLLVRDASQDEVGQLARRMDRMAEQLQHLMQTRQQLATAEERNRLARDLHDSVKQQIFSVAMQLGSLRVLLKRDTDKALRRLDEIEGVVHQAQQELTALIRELRPGTLADRSLPQALQDMAMRWNQQTWIAIQFELENTVVTEQDRETTQNISIASEIEDAFFRIAQEALSNVARHSNATNVQLQLRYSAENISLTIADNGCGFSPARVLARSEQKRQGGVGLHSMRERIQELGGHIDIHSAEGKGTRITVACPMRPVVARLQPESSIL
ncbi:sensor histidine kinase [Dictyobacter arantiisoli]|uniref:Oxygen sensor histidine kinase NreB n=1 Tax=Dictyobacter arantiisoli TaxID=2014874 RepID=A0A5A5T6K2_9CHLR|nr:sensor histidine kinase [Dictyobacter arantiisoli]GCF06997.1 hypothetical protein KDI_05610 [Dictyobacter arantiisoli]